MNKSFLWFIFGIVIIVAIASAILYSQGYISIQTARLTGTVSYREKIALPQGSEIVAQIRDVTSGQPQVVAETKITTQGENVPVPFTISYNPMKISKDRSYDVYATIAVAGETKWVNIDYTPLLEGGVPKTSVDLMLVFAESAGQISASDLSGKVFRAAYFNGSEVPSDANYTISFDSGTMVAQICNMLSGNFNVTGNVIAGTLITTEKFCTSPAGIMQVEDAFKTMMSAGASLDFSSDTLTLSGNGQSIVFIQQ
ncbi:MAG TPA: YbaY family lipoprotein [Candidatus Staskawiczbacteria bacterium]|nr:YbaY family lipoprotein [Candidatus Staskawiczbacteria bacterium]